MEYDYFTIKEAAKKTQVPRTTIEYWIKMGLLTPEISTKNGYHIFDQATIFNISDIKFYQSLGLTLKEIKKLFYFDAKTQKEFIEKKIYLLKNQIIKMKQTVEDAIDYLQSLDAYINITENTYHFIECDFPFEKLFLINPKSKNYNIPANLSYLITVFDYDNPDTPPCFMTEYKLDLNQNPSWIKKTDSLFVKFFKFKFVKYSHEQNLNSIANDKKTIEEAGYVCHRCFYISKHRLSVNGKEGYSFEGFAEVTKKKAAGLF